MTERVLVCVAWPYANGPLHLGHVAGSLLPPDIFARYQRMRGRDVAMVSGSDMHGTPVQIAAENDGVAPEAFAARVNEGHKRSLLDLGVRFDLFTSTATANHREVAQDVFRTLLDAGYLAKQTMTQPYDPKARRFLPDRYVEGTCPHCGAEGARGDQCDACGRTLDPQELKDPRSKISGAPPEYRETEHFFLRLPAFQERLGAWVAQNKSHWRANTVNFTENWLKEGLKDRPITRDMTYGVPIPLDGYDDKRIYVWFEAVIGYLSATVELAKQRGDADGWKRYWLEPTRSYYFLGKDNIPFHTIIWPAMLMGYSDGKGVAYNLPYDVPANEFMNFQGAKFSKSRGNFITVDEALGSFQPDAVRYYLGINMPEKSDANWAWDDFVAKVNDELVGTWGNLAHRVVSFTRRHYTEIPPASTLTPRDEALLARIEQAHTNASDLLEKVELKKALREIMSLAAEGNRYVDERAPWKLAKEGRTEELQTVLHVALRLVRALAILTAPYLPFSSEKLWRALGGEGSVHDAPWDAALADVPTGAPLAEPEVLFTKLDPAKVLAETETAKEKQPMESTQGAQQESPFKPEITIDDFAKLDLRVGLVKSCEAHPKADKLWVLKVDLGVEERQILAGLREHVTPDELVGKRIVVIANLAPRKIRGLESQGMVLAAEHGDVVAPLTPAKDVESGASIR